MSTQHDFDDDEDQISNNPAAGAPNYITPAGHQRLKNELLHLIDIERPEIVKIVSWAASNGDRSENGDYIYGKKRLREIDRRIRFLTKRLDIAEIVCAERAPNEDQIFFGATVHYSQNDGQEYTVSIVGVDEVNLDLGRISWVSPVAQALLKTREGDTVTLRTPQGQIEIDILDVSYPILN